MTAQLLRWLDTAAHGLDRIHLIPARLLGWVCDRYDLWLGVTPDELRRMG